MQTPQVSPCIAEKPAQLSGTEAQGAERQAETTKLAEKFSRLRTYPTIAFRMLDRTFEYSNSETISRRPVHSAAHSYTQSISKPLKGCVTMAAHTVLVVEDDTNQRALYEEELLDEGYCVLTASDGREALRLVQSEKPNLVVLDVNMPVMDGLDTLSQMLEHDSKMPVIINTAYASYKDSFTSWSADAYIVKSGDLTELKTTIKRLLASQNPS
jgi:CheY-like chemotaxis protein